MSNHFQTKRKIEFADTDLAGIVHFSRFFVFMETAEHEFLNHIGTSVSTEMHGDKIGWPRLSAKCDYEQPLKFEDVVDIFVSLKKLSAKSITYQFEFKLGKTVVAKGEMISVFCICNPGERIRAVEISDDLRCKLSAYLVVERRG